MNNADIPGCDKIGDVLSCMQVTISRLQRNLSDLSAMDDLFDEMQELSELMKMAAMKMKMGMAVMKAKNKLDS